MIRTEVCEPGRCHMPGDPKECREHARNCIELAEQAITAEGCATLINLANHWIKLAAELESAPAFLNALKDMELNTPKDGAIQITASPNRRLGLSGLKPGARIPEIAFLPPRESDAES
jgi:hypothetical protein